VDYVTDTHSLLWHLYWPQRLGPAAKQVFSDAETGRACIHVPAVVVAEVLMVIQKGRLSGVDLNRVVPHLESMEQSSNYSLMSLTPATVIASRLFTLIPDIFDRLIVTEAKLLGFPLLTKDPIIHDSGIVPTVWN